MSGQIKIEIPKDKIADFCRRWKISEFALFGSVLREDFGPESDVDVLVEFDPAHIPGLIRFAGMEIELSEILGRKQASTPLTSSAAISGTKCWPKRGSNMSQHDCIRHLSLDICH
jgi:hypothetical protein